MCVYGNTAPVSRSDGNSQDIQVRRHQMSLLGKDKLYISAYLYTHFFPSVDPLAKLCLPPLLRAESASQSLRHFESGPSLCLCTWKPVQET